MSNNQQAINAILEDTRRAFFQELGRYVEELRRREIATGSPSLDQQRNVFHIIRGGAGFLKIVEIEILARQIEDLLATVSAAENAQVTAPNHHVLSECQELISNFCKVAEKLLDI